MCLDQMIRSGVFLCAGLQHTVQLAQPSIIAEFRRWNTTSVVLYGAVAARVVDAQVDLGGLSVKRVFDEPTDHVVQGGDDDGRFDLGHDIRREWLDGHGRLHISEAVLIAALSVELSTLKDELSARAYSDAAAPFLGRSRQSNEGRSNDDVSSQGRVPTASPYRICDICCSSKAGPGIRHRAGFSGAPGPRPFSSQCSPERLTPPDAA